MKENNQIIENTNVENVEEVVKPYTFRKLNAKDIPLMVKILAKIKLNRFTEILKNETVIAMFSGKKDENEDNNTLLTGGTVILEAAQIILEGLGDCDEIFEMLANTSNLKREEVEALDIDVLFEMIIDFIKKKEFVGFFKAASKLIQ